jgi:hypothetical protein
MALLPNARYGEGCNVGDTSGHADAKEWRWKEATKSRFDDRHCDSAKHQSKIGQIRVYKLLGHARLKKLACRTAAARFKAMPMGALHYASQLLSNFTSN